MSVKATMQSRYVTSKASGHTLKWRVDMAENLMGALVGELPVDDAAAVDAVEAP
jgi:hypothetical protein